MAIQVWPPPENEKLKEKKEEIKQESVQESVQPVESVEPTEPILPKVEEPQEDVVYVHDKEEINQEEINQEETNQDLTSTMRRRGRPRKSL